MSHADICSCGEQEDHVVARRKTADGISVQVWSDGAVTCGINTYVCMAPRSAFARRRAVDAGWLLAGLVELYDHAELRRLAVNCRKAFHQLSLQPIDYARSVMAGVKFQSLKKGAGIRHAGGCHCDRCLATIARISAVPESRRLYVGTDIANGMTVYRRVR